jgi:hypothetical protein
MDLSATTVRILFEAAAAGGISGDRLAEGLLDLERLRTSSARVSWNTSVAVVERLCF